jgi:hypothetical protein
MKNLSIINHQMQKYQIKSSLTSTDKKQFEVNCRVQFIVNHLQARINFIQSHLNYIGIKVYKCINNFNYIAVDEIRKGTKENFNPVDLQTEISFTQELFEEFCKNYIDYTIKGLTTDFCVGEVTKSSGCKLTDLIFEWELECKQELLKIYRQAI